MKRTGILLCMAAAACCACRTTPPEARLTIVLPPQAPGVSVEYNGRLSLIDRSYRQCVAEKNEAGQWEVTVPLADGAQYFLLQRNPLYLSPGDRLTLEMHDDPNQTVITGTGNGAAINNYLKKRYYLKRGSFLEAGNNKDICRPTLEATIAALDSATAARRRELDALPAGRAFKEQEAIRIKADFVNSLLYYPVYNHPAIFGDTVQVLPRTEYLATMDAYYEKIQPRVQPLLDELAADDRYLDLEVVRLTLHHFSTLKGYTVQQSEHFKTLFAVGEQASRINASMNREQYDRLAAFGQTIAPAQLRAIYEERLARNTRFVEGRPAVDVTVTDTAGNRQLWSTCKGRPMYVDVWATWCAPCRMESPVFRALSERYPHIRFVAVSIDENRQAWEKHLQTPRAGRVTELWADAEMSRRWEITGIPRFMLIDSDFNIIMADAPRPSDTEAIIPLLEKYNVQTF